MKKIVSLLMILAILATFTACDSELLGSFDSSNGGGGAQVSADGNGVQVEFEETTIKEQVLYNENNIKITASELDINGDMGPEIKLLVENNTSYNLNIFSKNVSVNDFLSNFDNSITVSAGEKTDGAIVLKSDILAEAQITTIQKIEFYFSITDSATFSELYASDVITIETSADASFVQKFDDSGTLVHDQKDVRIVAKGVDTQNSIWGMDVDFYIENNSDQDFILEAKDVLVNGKKIDHYFSPDPVAGKKMFGIMSFKEEDLKEAGIQEINELELRFIFIDNQSYEITYESDLAKVSFK